MPAMFNFSPAPSFGRQVLAATLACACSTLAQATETTLPVIVVTGNPLVRDSTSSAVSVLQGSALWLRQSSSLGETLDGLPGVSATSFGPGASRPIIRGLDGDRIRILQNGVTALDASALSFDHAVAQDTLGVERIEVLRGAAALQYGGSAVGGVVNSVDRRIPRKPVNEASGQLDVQWGGASRERVGAAALDAGNGQFAVHADASSRKADSLRIPGHAWSARQRVLVAQTADGDAAPSSPEGHLPNSDGHSSTGSLGASWFGHDVQLGASYSGYKSEYGSVAEPDVRLDMKQDKWAVAGEWRNLTGPITALTFDAGHTDYRHAEREHGEVGTSFSNQGYEARLEAKQRKLGLWDGVIGWQGSSASFAALGEEAFVPRTRTTSHALFALQEWSADPALRINFGLRFERSVLTPDAQDNPRFADANRRSFNASSFAVGALHKFAYAWSLGSNLSFTERAPSFYELYANGEHVATGIVERGDAQAGKEKARAVDLTLRYAADGASASISAYYSRFANFIALQPTGRSCVKDECGIGGAGTAEYRYAGVPATISGFELEGKWPLKLDLPGEWTLDGQADYTRASQRNNDEPLPRIAPLRMGAGVAYRLATLETRIGIKYVAEQTRVPANDTPSAAYSTLDASVSYWLNTGNTDVMICLRADNLTNREVRPATSILREIAPQGGRAFRAGLRAAF